MIMPKAWKEYNKLPSKKMTEIPTLNELNGSNWALKSKSVQRFNGAIAKKRKRHGAAYPLSLAKYFIEIFTKKGDTVLDPFMGVGTTLDAAQVLGRNGVGFEINKEYVQLAKKGLEKVDRTEQDYKGKAKQQYVEDSCLNLKKYLENQSIELILTSPPYCNLLNNTIGIFGGTDYEKNGYKDSKRKLPSPYSDDTRDFGNLEWNKFCGKIEETMGLLYDVAKQGAYNAWVVRDYRYMQNNIPYISLHCKIAELGAKAGWVLTDYVIWDQTDQRKLVKLGGNKSRRFYYNLGHSYVVIMRKNIEGEKFRNAK